jgi:hypothetical protein
MNTEVSKFIIMTSVFLVVAIVLVVSLAPITIHAEPMSSSNYKIQSDSMNFGGTRSASATYTIEDTAGETATGMSSSTNYTMSAGYQQMDNVFISISSAADVTMTPAIGGVTGGTSDGSTSFTVTTDNPAGYTGTITASSSPAMSSPLDSFADYAPAGANPDANFAVAATASAFGFSPEGTDIAPRYKDTGGGTPVCGSGSSDTALTCWDGLSTSPKTILNRTSQNSPAGTLSTIRFKAGSGNAHIQKEGQYVATTTITVLPL